MQKGFELERDERQDEVEQVEKKTIEMKDKKNCCIFFFGFRFAEECFGNRKKLI